MDFAIYHDERIRGEKYAVYYYEGWTLFVCDSCPPMDVQMQLFYQFAVPYINQMPLRMPLRELLAHIGDGPSPERMLWLCGDMFRTGNRVIRLGKFTVSRFPTSGKQCLGLCISANKLNMMHLMHLEPNVSEEFIREQSADIVKYVVCDHCDAQSLLPLLQAWKTSTIIPLNPERDTELVETVSKVRPVVVIPEGQKIVLLSPDSWDVPEASLVLMNADHGDFEEVKNPNHEPWGTIEERPVGDFKNFEDATAVLQRVRFDSPNLIGLNIYDEEDLTPFASRSFRTDMSVIASTSFRNCPGKGDQLPFPAGEKVWMITDYEALVPCEIIRMPTEEDKQNNYFHGCSRKWKNYKSHLCSWEQDVVLVRPLVLLKSSDLRFKMHDVELVQRTKLYPYRAFPAESQGE
jgi:hypothetical protein